ncbi:hypothetical protein T492DRAFT_848340 [Pavlovales sp. CCMP2436]|nr:hypothetical protein T492DRAFT_848340 [Pavlovales sp. CCMP2436]
MQAESEVERLEREAMANPTMQTLQALFVGRAQAHHDEMKARVISHGGQDALRGGGAALGHPSPLAASASPPLLSTAEAPSPHLGSRAPQRDISEAAELPGLEDKLTPALQPADPSTIPLSSLGVDEACALLEELIKPNAFRRVRITGADLACLSDDRLCELGVWGVPRRKAVLEELRNMAQHGVSAGRVGMLVQSRTNEEAVDWLARRGLSSSATAIHLRGGLPDHRSPNRLWALSARAS